MPNSSIEITESQVLMENGRLFPPSYVGLDDKDGTVAVGWALGAYGSCESAVRWLRDNRRYVTDANVEKQTLEGSWRSIRLSTNRIDGKYYTIQAFRKGWITSLVSGSAIDFTEARYVSHDELPATDSGDVATPPAGDNTWGNPEQYAFLEWQGCDPEKVDTIRASIEALLNTTHTLTVNGEALGGSFRILRVFPAIDWQSQDQDRSATIRVLFGKPRWNLKYDTAYGTPLAGTGYELQNVPKSIAQSLLDTYDAITGAEPSISSLNERGLVNIRFQIPNLNTANAVTDASDIIVTQKDKFETVTTYYFYNLEDPLATPDYDTDGNNEVYTANWQRNFRDGTAFGQIRKIVPTAYDSGWVDYPSKGGTVYKRTFSNQTLTWLNGVLDGGGYVVNTRSVQVSARPNRHSSAATAAKDLWDGVIVSAPASSSKYTWTDFDENEYWLYSIEVKTQRVKVDAGSNETKYALQRRKFLHIWAYRQDDDIDALTAWARSITGDAGGDWAGASDPTTGVPVFAILGFKAHGTNNFGFLTLYPADMTEPQPVGGGYYRIRKHGIMCEEWTTDGSGGVEYTVGDDYTDWSLGTVI